MKVAADRNRCISAGMCALTAPDLFDQDEDGRVVPLAEGHLADADLETARKAVALCPSRALSLHDGGADEAQDNTPATP